ncbi:protoporphyrinogen oxidase [Planococcus maitriensis]|uniref:Coproporphyrinogen III oxidase n=1 Tax=Planococcus maitriensis TaxID=221799 RepID=A0A365K6E3_9BACL|nr:protoporphyrinogen oxidase [Planococcus maitriensis]RAZ67753.1 protoporphyrinogen oxidase [Planococcus maitriensis]
MKKAVVIGGGITGLSAMHYLERMKKQHGLDLELELIEKEAQLGGKIRTVKKDGFAMEVGADSIVARHASVLPLVEELGLEEQMVYNGTGISYLYTDNQLHAIPKDTVFGIPMDREALFSSTLVSEQGKERAMEDFETVNDRFTKDSSIGEFLEEFLGKELVERQIAPVLSGVYSGSLRELTLASTLPYLIDYKNDYGSIIKGFEAHKKTFQGAANKKFISFEGGMAALIDRLEEQLETALVRKGVGTSSLEKQDGRYKLNFSDGTSSEADFVVLAIPHQQAQALVKDETLGEEFGQLINSSLISVYLGYDLPDGQLPADGTGFIVSEGSDLACNACTWTSRKWPHTSAQHKLLVRLFYKSTNPVFAELQKGSDEQVAATAKADIQKSLGIEQQPAVIEITSWNELMPNYHMGHKTAVTSLEARLKSAYPGIYLAGSSYYGVGIGACIQNGKDVAQKIAQAMGEI